MQSKPSKFNRLLAKAGIAHEIYNLCTGSAPTLRELLLGMGPSGKVTYTQQQDRFRANDVREFRGDPSKAEALGWRRKISQEQMLSDLVASAD